MADMAYIVGGVWLRELCGVIFTIGYIQTHPNCAGFFRLT